MINPKELNIDTGDVLQEPFDRNSHESNSHKGMFSTGHSDSHGDLQPSMPSYWGNASLDLDLVHPSKKLDVGSLPLSTHTESTAPQESFSSASSSFFDATIFDSNRYAHYDDVDDESITDAFVNEVGSNNELSDVDHQDMPISIANLGPRQILHDSFGSLDGESIVGHHPLAAHEDLANGDGGSVASLNDAFQNLNKCMQRSSETRELIKMLSSSDPNLFGNSDASDFVMQDAQPGALIQGVTSLNMTSGNDSFGSGLSKTARTGLDMKRSGIAPLRASKSIGSIYDMKRTGIAPLMPSEGMFVRAPKKVKLTSRTRNTLLRELYSVSAKSKQAKLKK